MNTPNNTNRGYQQPRTHPPSPTPPPPRTASNPPDKTDPRPPHPPFPHNLKHSQPLTEQVYGVRLAGKKIVATCPREIGAPDNGIVRIANPDAPGQKSQPGTWNELHRHDKCQSKALGGTESCNGLRPKKYRDRFRPLGISFNELLRRSYRPRWRLGMRVP